MADQYIKMILALPEEFYIDSKLKFGDHVIALGPDIEMIYISGPVSGLGENWNVCRYLNSEYEISISNQLRLLPSPEQLLKMCECEDEIYFESLTLLHFANWLEDKVTKRHDFCLKYRSAKEMMLLWVMETRYNKMWNGEAWK